jgi:OTT_1508-like deaminase
MCSERILCRLRLIAKRWHPPKQTIKKAIKGAVDSLRRLENSGAQDRKLLPIATLFAKKAKEVTKLVDSWINHRTPARLRELVEGIHCLWQVGDLHALFGTIPNHFMSPSSRNSLLNILSKVSRYREAARFLYRTAKKFPIVQQMRVLFVNLPRKAFLRTLPNQYNPTLPSTFLRISAPRGRQGDLGRVCHLLNTNEPEASSRFAEQTWKTLKKAKIHAEIQLLFYCELRDSELPSRVVCSSKDACFLCNAFMLVHGKMHTPRCHGRLYPGWRLPQFPKPHDIEHRFNQVLENHARNSLATLLSRKQKTVYLDPMESTLLMLPMSASTLCNLAPGAAISEGEVTKPTPIDGAAVGTRPLQIPSVSNFEARTDAGITVTEYNVSGQTSNDSVSQAIPRILSSPQGLSSQGSISDSCVLRQGQKLLKGVVADNTSPLYIAGPLRVQIEYSTGPGLNTPGPPWELVYGIERLTVEEAERLQEHQAISIVDATSLKGEIPHAVDDENCLYIAAQGSILKIVLHPRMARVGG